MSTAAANGIVISYDDAGDGRDVLLLVHGHPFNRSMWTPQVRAFSQLGWRVIAPDLRGYGETTVVAGKTTLDVFADDLASLLDHVGVDRVVIGGLSMGGQIAMEFARLRSDRLRGIVLAATFSRAESAEGKQGRQAMAERLLREGMREYARDVLPRMVAPHNVVTLPAVAESVLRMMERTDPIGAAAALRGRAERPPYEEVLRSLRIPALIVTGDQDAFTTRADVAAMSALVAQASVVWIKGAGHLPNLEDAAAFNQAVARFLASVQGGAPGA